MAARLVSERQRLQLTQARMASAAGVSTASQIGYEQGLRAPPTDYTSQLQTLGVDVHYVMFGVRMEDFASDTLDWELMGRIGVAVTSWCASRGFEIRADKFGEVLRLLYNECRRRPRHEPVDVSRVLKLVA